MDHGGGAGVGPRGHDAPSCVRRPVMAGRAAVQEIATRVKGKLRDECLHKARQRRQDVLEHRRSANDTQAELRGTIRQMLAEEVSRYMVDGMRPENHGGTAAAAGTQHQRMAPPTPCAALPYTAAGAGSSGAGGRAHAAEMAVAGVYGAADGSLAMQEAAAQPAPPAPGEPGDSWEWGWSDEYDTSAAVLADLEDELYNAIAAELDAMEAEEQRYLRDMAREAEERGAAAPWGVVAAPPPSCSSDADMVMMMSDDGPRPEPLAAGAGAGAGVLCPICGTADLVELHGIIACPRERWQLDARAEGLDLAQLRLALASTFEEHYASGCRGHLHFSLDGSLGREAGAPSLLARCSECHALRVVI